MEKKATTLEQRQKLQDAGFIRVDGLKMARPGKIPSSRNLETLESKPEWLGRWDAKANLLAIYTEGGEIWLGGSSAVEGDGRAAKIVKLVHEFCPNGRGAFVPLANGEALASREIIKRNGDPNW